MLSDRRVIEIGDNGIDSNVDKKHDMIKEKIEEIKEIKKKGVDKRVIDGICKFIIDIENESNQLYFSNGESVSSKIIEHINIRDSMKLEWTMKWGKMILAEKILSSDDLYLWRYGEADVPRLVILALVTDNHEFIRLLVNSGYKIGQQVHRLSTEWDAEE